MRISPDEVASIVKSVPPVHMGTPSRNDINRLVARLRARLRRDADEHMQPWVLLLDEVVRFFIYLERYQYTRALTKETTPFALQLSRLRSDALSLRELVLLGQEASAYTIARTLVEGVELAMAMAEDPTFAISHFDAEDGRVFWKSEIAYGKIYKRVEKFLRRVGGSERQADEYIADHKAIKNSLSGHVHLASYAAFRAGATPSLTDPGMLHFGSLGALSVHLPGLCLMVAEETRIFSVCCINGFVKPNPLPVFSVYRPTKKLHDVVGSAHVLQEIFLRYGEQLQEIADSLLEHYEPAI